MHNPRPLLRQGALRPSPWDVTWPRGPAWGRAAPVGGGLSWASCCHPSSGRKGSQGDTVTMVGQSHSLSKGTRLPRRGRQGSEDVSDLGA